MFNTQDLLTGPREEGHWRKEPLRKRGRRVGKKYGREIGQRNGVCVDSILRSLFQKGSHLRFFFFELFKNSLN